MLLNYKVCDNGNALKCYFQNNYDVIAYRKVCCCGSVFSFFCEHSKNYHFFAILGAVRLVSPHFKATMVKCGMRVRTWDSLHQAKFCKNHLRGYTRYGQIYTKNYQFWGL